jgi:hypothetical protein
MRRLLGLTIAAALALAGAAHASVPEGFVGLYSDDAFYGDAAYRAEQMGLQSRLGVETIRQPFEWFRVEKRPGAFDWSDYDPYVAEAARQGLRILPMLMAPPEFHSSRPATSKSRAMFPPKRNADYARFVSAAVRRYGRGGIYWSAHPELPEAPITAWQVWNEPNIPNFWRSGPDPAEYVALLRAASDAIRAADPGAEVVTAGLPNSALGIPFLEFLDGMYEAGAKGVFDSLAIHPYAPRVDELLALTESARLRMDEHGDRSSLWITEFGWTTGGAKSRFTVSEEGQANRISTTLFALAAERRALRLRGFVYFKWRDAPPYPDSDPWPLHAGLLEDDGLPKPALWSFARSVYALESPGSDFAGEAVPLISRRTVRLSPRGFAGVFVQCPSPRAGACAGNLELRTERGARCGGRVFGQGALIGTAKFRIPVSPALVPVRVRAAARRFVGCVKQLRVRATAVRGREAVAATSASAVFVLRAR